MQQHIAADDKAWKSSLAGAPPWYEDKFAALGRASLGNVMDEGKCLVCGTAVGAGTRSKPLGVVHIPQPHLLEDWERLMDGAQDPLGGGEGMLWSHYKPRGAVDASIPEHVCHCMGMGDGARC